VAIGLQWRDPQRSPIYASVDMTYPGSVLSHTLRRPYLGKRFLSPLTVGLIIGILVQACNGRQSVTQNTGNAAQTGNAATSSVLVSFPADPSSALQYQLAIDPCVQEKCPVVVRLTNGNRVLDSAKLEWNSTTQESSPEDVDAQWGGADPLDSSARLKAFATGEEASYLSMLARLVKVTADRVGLLVTQRAGWDEVKHHHDLFLIDGEKLRHDWSGTEGAGPTWSATAVVPGVGKAEQVLFFSGFRYPTEDEPDHLSVWKVAWDPAQQKIVESAVGDSVSLRLLSFGGYPNVAKARAARDNANSCVPPVLWVLNSSFYKGAPGKVLLGTITARPELVAAVLAAAQKCSPPLRGSTLAYEEAQ